MDAEKLRSLQPELDRFIARFDDCFDNSNVHHVPIYIAGQLSDLDRKSVEPIAKRAQVPPRTLQEFLSLNSWDHNAVRNRLQKIVATEHLGPNGVGLIDETSFVKKGNCSPGVKRQWCGHLGKTENCVVTVHLGYATADFQSLIDGELFLPEDWSNDRERCEKAGIPDSVVYRSKWRIALELYDRSLTNGMKYSWLTFDEYYGGKPEFLRELTQRKQFYVAEVPKSTYIWLDKPPLIPLESTSPDENQGFRLAENAPKPVRMDHAMGNDPRLRDTPWEKYRLENRQQGPSVWEVKHMHVWIKDENGLPIFQHMIVARHVLSNGDTKYFMSNAPENTATETLLLVALTRHKVERCFQDQKSEVGLDHYEGRKHSGLIRHLILSCMSQLFLVQAVLGRRGEKSGVDGESNSQGDLGADSSEMAFRRGSAKVAGAVGGRNRGNAKEKRSVAKVPRSKDTSPTPRSGHPSGRRPVVRLADGVAG